MLSLGTIERRPVAVGRVVAGQRRDSSEAPECVAELLCELDGGDGRPERADRDDRGARGCHGETPARLQLERKDSRHRDREAGIPVEEPVKDVRVQLEQLAVPNRLHGRRPRRPGQERELADRRARAELADGSQAVLLIDENSEPPAAHEEHAIRRISLPDDDLTRAHLDRPKALRELRQRLLVRPCQKRDAGQELVLRADSRLNAHVVLPQRFTSPVSRPARRPRGGDPPAPASP